MSEPDTKPAAAAAALSCSWHIVGEWNPFLGAVNPPKAQEAPQNARKPEDTDAPR